MRPLSRIALAVCSASLLLLFFSTLSTLSAIASEQRDVSVGVEIWKGVVTKRLVSPQELKKQPVGGLREEGGQRRESAEDSWSGALLLQSAAAQGVGAGPHSEPIGSVGATRGVNAIA